MRTSSSRRACVLGLLLAAVSCKTVPIDPSDSSAPTVTIKVKGNDGQYHPLSQVDYANNNQEVLEVMAIVEDPQGVKSIHLYYDDKAVASAYCSGTIHNGTFAVAGLPAEVQDTLSGSSGKVPTKLTALLEMSGVYALANNPVGVSGTCYPANNTVIGLRCVGTNWSSNAANASGSASLDLRFKF